MAISITSATTSTAPLQTGGIGQPNLWTARFQTDRLTIASMAGLRLFVHFAQATDGSNFPFFLIDPINISGNLRYQAVQPLYWSYDILGTETTSATPFGGPQYDMTFAYPPDPAAEGRIRVGSAKVQFFDAGGGGGNPVFVEISIYWLNQMDTCPPIHQFQAQVNRAKLLRDTVASTQDAILTGNTSFFRAAKRFGLQLCIIETFTGASNQQVAAQLYSPARARFWNNQTPPALLPNALTNPVFAFVNPDGPSDVLNVNSITNVTLDIDAAALPSNYYFGILRTDSVGEDLFYAAQQSVCMQYWNGVLSGPLPTQYEIPITGITGLASPTTISGTTRQLTADVLGSALVVGATYRVFFVVEDAGTPGQWYPFLSEPITAADCPLRALPDVLVNELANYQATYGSYIVASAQQFVRSTIEVDGTVGYDPSRPITLADAAVGVQLDAYYDEAIGGVTYRQYVYRGTANRVNGNWPTGAAIVVAATPGGLTAQAVLRIEAAPNQLNIATQNLTTNLYQAQRTGNQDWRGKTIELRYTILLQQTGYQEAVEVYQKIQVPANVDTGTLSLTYSDTGLPVRQLCTTDAPIIACITEPGGDEFEYQLVIAPAGNRPIADLNSAPTYGILPQRTNPIFAGWPAATEDGTACGTLDMSRLTPGQQYQLCWVRRTPPNFACYSLDFLGGPDGSNSEYVLTDPTPLLNFGTGPFAVSAWIYTDAGPFDGGAAVSRRPQGGTDETGWVLGPIADGLQVVLSNNPLGGVTATFVKGIVPGWNHVVVDFADLDASTWTVYINGVAQPPDTGWPQTIGVVTSFDPAEILPPLALGIDTPVNTEDYFNGRLANVAIFGQAVSATEALDLYNDGICGDPTALGLTNVVWYPLREVSGTTAPEPVNGITGTLTNYLPTRTAPGGGAWQPA
jgi:hypothetical protein